MSHITVIGGSGNVGKNIVNEAVARGFQVTSLSRDLPASPIDGVDYQTGDALDPVVLQSAVNGADVVVTAMAPRGPMEGKVAPAVRDLAAAAQQAGVRLGVVGGAGSLLVGPDGPMLADTDGFPAAFQAEAHEMAQVLDDLRASDDGLDWFLLSPAPDFNPTTPGEHTGNFRLGGDVVMWADDGTSDISAADFAQAFVDEIEQPAHQRQRFTVAY
jgi:putative NADH-flavin reductase